MSVRLRNVGAEPFVDRFAGEVYTILPGETAVVPDGAANLWLGDPSLPEPQRTADRSRAALRRVTGLPPLVRVDEAAPSAAATEEAVAPIEGPTAEDAIAALKDEDARAADQVCPVCGKVVGSPVGLRSHLAAHRRRGEEASAT